MIVTLDLTKRQFNQIIRSLENDWVDNANVNQSVINRILLKLHKAEKKG